jgi:hypothetical protein
MAGMMPIDLGLGVAGSNASSAQSGGPFVNNAEITFGDGSYGANELSQSATTSASAAASGKGSAADGNPYASNAGLIPSLSSLTSSPMLLIVAAALLAGVAIWYFNTK